MRRAIVAAAITALPSNAAADELLDRLAATQWPEAKPCGGLLRIAETEEDEPEIRSIRLDPASGTSEMLEGPPDEMRAYAADPEARIDPEARPIRVSEGPNAKLEVGFTPYEAAAAIGGFGYVRQPDAGPLAVYRSDSLPPGTFEVSGRDFSDHASATLYVDDRGDVPVVERRIMTLESEMRVPLVARVRTLRNENAYALIGGVPQPVLMALSYDADVMGDHEVGTVVLTMSEQDCRPPDDAAR